MPKGKITLKGQDNLELFKTAAEAYDLRYEEVGSVGKTLILIVTYKTAQQLIDLGKTISELENRPCISECDKLATKDELSNYSEKLKEHSEKKEVEKDVEQPKETTSKKSVSGSKK